LIPMCHTILIEKSSIDFNILEKTSEIEVMCTVSTTGKTGVEIEAMTGAMIALLTIYDMCKSIDKKMIIEQVYLYKKTGGKSGTILNDIDN
jgi:cyclic pyranopterin phosphate synthase